MARFEKKVHAEGHLIDSDLLSQVMDRIIREGGHFKILDFSIGRTNEEFSRIEMIIQAASSGELAALLEELSAYGFAPSEPTSARFEPAPAPGVAPEEFYSSTNQHTEVLVESAWRAVGAQRMDACIVDRGSEGLQCVKLRDLKKNEPVLVGVEGVRVVPEFTPRDRADFGFMSHDVSSERQVRLAVEHIADLITSIKESGRRAVWVPGPVVIHTGAAGDLAALVTAGFVDAVLSGNALAVHDAESALYGTSLGVSLADGERVHLGHRHHMRAINTIRRAGGLEGAVRKGVLRSGIFHALVHHGIPFVLAGSIRDDGPLPDTMMDLIAAQDAYAAELRGAGIVIVLASMLHGIGVANMLPGGVPLVCVDIHPAVVTKLADRGSAQTHGIVTDVGLFLHLLRGRLAPAGAQPRQRKDGV